MTSQSMKTKKITALVLAALMAAGTTATAFADSDVVNRGGDLDDKRPLTFNDETIYENEDGVLTPSTDFRPGDTLYIRLDELNANGDKKIEDEKDDMNVYADWKVGKDLGAEVDVDWVNYSKVAIGTPDSQIMSVIITLPENETTKVEDLAGTIRVGRTSSAAKKGPAFDLEVSFFSDATLTNTPNFDGGNLPTGSTGIVTFDKEAGEIDIDFDDIATFTVDVDGQGKLNLAWNTDFDKEFGAMYDYANLHFFNFEGTPAFNKTGTMMVYADKDTFIYEATEDGAKEIDATYDEDYEAWVFKTRKLTSYVVSDVELTDKTVTEDNSSSTTDGGKDNPDTGR